MLWHWTNQAYVLMSYQKCCPCKVKVPSDSYIVFLVDNQILGEQQPARRTSEVAFRFPTYPKPSYTCCTWVPPKDTIKKMPPAVCLKLLSYCKPCCCFFSFLPKCNWKDETQLICAKIHFKKLFIRLYTTGIQRLIINMVYCTWMARDSNWKTSFPKTYTASFQ